MRGFETYSQKRKAALRHRKIVCALCAAVALGAGWVLMRPAITLTDQPECGMEAHTHSDVCYSLETGPAPLLCAQEEHEHGDNCYDAEGNLLCQQQEHIHAEGCYGQPETYQVLTCTVPEHTHTDACYPVPEPTPAYTVGPILDCGMAEHVHGEGCYDGADLICTIPEHIHTDSCSPQPETEPQPEQTQPEEEETQPEEEPQEPEAPEEAAWENLTEAEKRQALFAALHIETEEDAAAFDALLATYEKTLDDIHSLLLEQEAAGTPIETLAALQACLEEAASEEPAESTEPAEAVLTPLEELRQRLGIESEEDAAALDGLLERFGLTPEEILEGLKEIEADPEAEKIDSLEALQDLLEQTVAVKTLETEDGTLTLKEGGGYTGTMTIGDLTVTVETDNWVADMDGCKLSVSTVNTEPVKMDHGMVVVDKGIEVKILNGDGSAYAGNGTVKITVTSETAMTASTEPKIYHRENGNLVEYGSWPGVTLSEDRKTLQTGSGFPLPAEFLIDHWEYSNAKFEDWPGAEYSIAYILKNYNLFLSGDYSGTHVVGPMIVNSVSKTSGLGGLTTGPRYSAPHYVPDYIGALQGTLTNIPGGVITANPSTPVYFGETIKTLNLTYNLVDAGTGNEADNQNYWYTKDYIDFTAAMNTISGEMSAIQKTSDKIPTRKGTGDDEKKQKNYTLPAGGVYEIPDGFFKKYEDGENSLLCDTLYLTDDTGGADTILIFRDTVVTLPTLVDSSGSDFGNTESGKSTGVVFFCPNATTVNGHAVTGHLVAPNATVNYTGGNYNGCVIAHDMVTTAEGHMWPYKGSRLVPERTSVQARKYINGEPMSETDTREFIFGLYRQSEGDAGYTYEQTPTVTGINAGPNVTFGYITFTTAGTYVYKMVEQMDKTYPGILFDPRAYYVKIEVTAKGSGFKATISYFKDEACTQPLDEGQTYPVFNNRYGESLPSTGGPGTLAYMLPGVFLMALALAGACISRKRRAA